MSKYELSREETIPMLDEHWIPMQMKQFSYSVKITWEEWESLVKIEEELEEAFLKQRLKAADTLPAIEIRERQIKFLLSELKIKVTDTELKVIIAKAKNLSSKKN